MRGAIAQDLHGAFAEWYAQAKATNCSKYLYSLSINPDHRQGPFTREHYYDFIRRTEKDSAFPTSPAPSSFTSSTGASTAMSSGPASTREKVKAVQLSHDHQKLRAVAQEYAQDHKLTLPPGMRNDRGKARLPRRTPKTENLGEKQQQERSGISKTAAPRADHEALARKFTTPAVSSRRLRPTATSSPAATNAPMSSSISTAKFTVSRASSTA